MSFDLTAIAEQFNTEDKAREFFEQMRWPNGPICPHCGALNEAHRIPQKTKRKGAKGRNRPGLWYCRACQDQFSVTEGTVMECTHIPLNKWLLAFLLLGASKKGMSAHQLHRTLGVTYRSAWFMAHRIRYAMSQEPIKTKLAGDVIELDETYVGGRGRIGHNPPKYPVVSLVSRKGGSRSVAVANVTGDTLRAVLRQHAPFETTLYADSGSGHKSLDECVNKLELVNHEAGEYVRGPVHTNTVEGFFGILKRGIYGTYHHVSPHHLQRYLHEFDFRYSNRHISDGDRTQAAIVATQGKRLRYRELPAYGKQEKPKGRTWRGRPKPKQEGPLTTGDQP